MLKFIGILWGLSGAIVALIKICGLFLPPFSPTDQNAMAITAITIPVAIFTVLLMGSTFRQIN